MSKKVFVTGANGFTGSRLCKTLVEQGDHVVAFVRKSSNLDLLADLEVEIVYGDLAEENGIPNKALRGVEIVYNVAALYRQEGGSRDVFFKVNADGTERLLKAAMEANVSRFVHCSTGGVHGHIENPPANEEAPYSPGDWYQESKLEGEKRALAFCQKHNFPVSVIRPAPIYGPGDLRFLKLFKAINNGTFLMLGSGEVFYHFVYVDDLAHGFILAGNKEVAVGEPFIIAGEEYVTINKLVQLIAEELGKSVPKHHLPVWPVMAAAKVCKAVCQPLGIEPPLYPRRLDFFIKDRAFDSSKAKKMLGYQPKVDLKHGISCTANWYRQKNYL